MAIYARPLGFVARSSCRGFISAASFSTARPNKAKNQVFSPIRNPDTFGTHILLSSSARTPLVTLWTTSWCPSCKAVAPLLQSIVESGVGEAEGGVAYAPVEFDSPDMQRANLALDYMITSVPTLLSFDAGEAQLETKVVDGRLLTDRAFLEDWVRAEALRHGGRGGGGGLPGMSFFGGLFSGSK
ncbi:hypothetical protein RB595_005396 [Gaeumannomyces hyphopodioides]